MVQKGMIKVYYGANDVMLTLPRLQIYIHANSSLSNQTNQVNNKVYQKKHLSVIWINHRNFIFHFD